jgi:hypothetical protein
VYAAFLFLLARSGGPQNRPEDLLGNEQRVACQIVSELLQSLRDPGVDGLGLQLSDPPLTWNTVNSRKPAILEHVAARVCGDLAPLLLVKGLFEQTLIYTRYGAKARA